jgi:hypothetical protein
MVSVPRCGEPPTGGVNRGMPAKMYDQSLFLQTLSRFAVLPARYDLEAALSVLAESVTSVLGLSGCGVTMAVGGRLRFLTAVSQASGEFERDQGEQQAGPCRDAYDSGQVVRVTDVRKESARWPEFSATAARLAVAGVAEVPMWLDHQIIGVLSLYSGEPRKWCDQDIAVAGVLADVATSYVVNASKRHQQRQLSDQLQKALESRVVIEQAKGITASKKSVTIDQAFQLIRQQARNNNVSLRVVADEIVAGGGVRSEPQGGCCPTPAFAQTMNMLSTGIDLSTSVRRQRVFGARASLSAHTRTRVVGLNRCGSGPFSVVRLVGGLCVAARGGRSWTVPPRPRKRVWGRLHRAFKSHRHRQGVVTKLPGFKLRNPSPVAGNGF